MNEFAEMLCDGLERTEETTGATMIWRSKPYPCSGGVESHGKKLDLGGFQFHSDCPIVMRVAAFGQDPQPALKQVIGYSSATDVAPTTWRIDEIRPIWGEIVVLECNDPSQ